MNIQPNEKSLILLGETRNAIIALRDRTGCSLKEAADKIKEFRILNGIIDPTKLIGVIGDRLEFEAYLGVKPRKSLSETASDIGDFLGIKFTIDESGYYEDFKTFYSFAMGFKILLQEPPEYTFSESEEKFYTLQVESTTEAAGDGTEIRVNLDGFLKRYFDSIELTNGKEVETFIIKRKV